MVRKKPIDQIITHPGGSHKDEFLACAVLLHYFPVEIYRKDPEQSELDDARIAVIDIGHQYEPSLNNFDHHQFPRDHEPTCSLTLILRHFGLETDARRFCEWFETLEWFDTRGAISTAKWLETSFESVRKLNSPIDVSMMRWFASGNHWKSGDAIWEIMRKIGSDLVEYLELMHERREFIQEHHEIWDVKTASGKSVKILFLPRTDPLPKDPSLGIAFFMEEYEGHLHGLIYPDRRGEGYGLSRHNDDPLLDMSQIEDETDVHFAHSRGFLAKSSATETDRLKELMAKSIVS